MKQKEKILAERAAKKLEKKGLSPEDIEKEVEKVGFSWPQIYFWFVLPFQNHTSWAAVNGCRSSWQGSRRKTWQLYQKKTRYWVYCGILCKLCNPSCLFPSLLKIPTISELTHNIGQGRKHGWTSEEVKFVHEFWWDWCKWPLIWYLNVIVLANLKREVHTPKLN